MPLEEENLQPKAIFAYTILDPISLIRGIRITAGGIITLFEGETVECINSEGGGQLENLALNTVLANPSFLEELRDCYSGLERPSSIKNASPCHTAEMHSSGVFSQNKGHIHLASPMVLEPNLLECFLKAIGIAQKDIAARNRLMHDERDYISNMRKQCVNKLEFIIDTKRPAIPQSEHPKIVDMYRQFFINNEQSIREAYCTARPQIHFELKPRIKEYITAGYKNDIPLKPKEREAIMAAQRTYFSDYVKNGASHAFFNAAIFSVIENILKECTTLEVSQINYLLHNVLLPSFLSPLFYHDWHSIIIYFALFETRNVLESSKIIKASLLLRALITMCSLGIHASFECLQPENPHNVVSPQEQMIASVTTSVIASGVAALTQVGINSVFKVGKALSHYFLGPSNITQSTGATQSAINASGLRPA